MLQVYFLCHPSPQETILFPSLDLPTNPSARRGFLPPVNSPGTFANSCSFDFILLCIYFYVLNPPNSRFNMIRSSMSCYLKEKLS